MAKDVVVMGGGVGGLSAAIYARLAGHNVVLLEAADFLGGKAAEICLEGFRLDPGPSIIILPRLYESLFRDAGRNMSDYLRFQRLDPISRVYFGEEPFIDLPASRNECEKLVDQISREDGRNFRTLLQRLDKIAPHIDRSIFTQPFDHAYQLLNLDLLAIGRYFDIRKPFKQLVDSWFKSPMMRAFFYGFPSYGGQSYNSKAPGALLIPYLMIQEGVFYPEGGVSAIPKALEVLARELGVDVRLNQRVTGIDAGPFHVRSALLEDGSKVGAEAFVSGIDRLTTKRWLGQISNLKPSFSYFTIHWGVRKKVDGLGHHTLLIPRDYEHGFEGLYARRDFPDPPIVYLNETTGVDPSVAPSGCSNLFGVVTSPSIEQHFEWSQESDRFRKVVIELMSGFGFDIDPKDMIFERVQTPITFEEKHGNYKGSLYGSDETHRLFGMFPQRNYDEQYRNLFYCGGSVQPGAGLPMVLLSGKFAAGKI